MLVSISVKNSTIMRRLLSPSIFVTFLASRSFIVTKWPHFIHRRRMLVKMILKRDMFSERFESTICYTARYMMVWKKKIIYTLLDL